MAGSMAPCWGRLSTFRDGSFDCSLSIHFCPDRPELRITVQDNTYYQLSSLEALFYPGFQAGDTVPQTDSGRELHGEQVHQLAPTGKRPGFPASAGLDIPGESYKKLLR